MKLTDQKYFTGLIYKCKILEKNQKKIKNIKNRLKLTECPENGVG